MIYETAGSTETSITFIKMPVKHNNSLNLITRCLYISLFGPHVSVIPMTIIRFVRDKVLKDLMMVMGMTETCGPKKLI